MKRLFTWNNFFWLIMLPLFALVFFYVVKSGQVYQFDHDEFHHSQITYLVDQGNKMYESFYLNYPPLYYWFLLPLFKIVGYGVQTMYAARNYMIGLFIIRMIFLYAAVSKVFSKRAAFLGLFLLAMNPISDMTIMQIRPDNLMMTFITFAFCCYIYARARKQMLLFGVAGMFAALSFLTLMKILPTIGVFFIVAAISSFYRKTLKQETIAVFGFLITLALCLLIFMARGLFNGFLQQTFFDAFIAFNALLYPVPYGFYFREGNSWIFGQASRSLSWVFAQVTFPLAGFGIREGLNHVYDKGSTLRRDVSLILIGSLIGQWVWILIVPSIFMQYYLPMDWIIAVLAGVAFDRLLLSERFSFVGRSAIMAGVLGFFVVFGFGSYQSNEFRSRINAHDNDAHFLNLWKAIPENSAIYPDVLFRPIGFPLPYQRYITELPESIAKRLPTVSASLEAKKVNYIFNDNGIISSLPEVDQQYIRNNFVPGGIDDQVYIRKQPL